MRRRWSVSGAVVLVVVIVGALAFVYQPFVAGSATGADQHLLISSGSLDPISGNEFPAYTYRYEAETSYYTFFSVRNEGPFPVTVIGLAADTGAELPNIPRAGELLVGSTDVGHDMIEWAAASPLDRANVESGSELWLWVRWEIGLCDASRPVPLAPGTSIGPPPWIPLRWSVFGIPRTTNVDLNYQVVFERPANDGTECSSPSAY